MFIANVQVVLVAAEHDSHDFHSGPSLVTIVQVAEDYRRSHRTSRMIPIDIEATKVMMLRPFILGLK